VVVTRQVAIPVLANVTVALVTNTIRGLPTEVPVGREHGLDRDSVVNCDSVLTVPKTAIVRSRGRLDPVALARLDEGLRIALQLD
jgi:mRNA interferase MazF